MPRRLSSRSLIALLVAGLAAPGLALFAANTRRAGRTARGRSDARPEAAARRSPPRRSPQRPPRRRPAAASAVPKVEFEKYTLPNGLQVILHVDRKLPIVHVNQWFHVGSKNEKPGRTGFAHLFEHMMFQGSKNVPGEYFTVAEQAGANLQEGGVNGTTDNDRTNYFATVPSGNLEALLWLESDRLATLLDVTDLKKLDNQRDVVKNERRQGLENSPYGRWLDILFDQLFPKGHPYSLAGHRQHGGPERRLARRREGVLPPLLHAQQPVAGDRRRLRSGAGEAAGREVLRRPAAGAGARSSGALDSRRSPASASSRSPTACRRSAPTWCGRRPSTSAPTMRR